MADGGGERLGGLPLADGAGGGAGGRPLGSRGGRRPRGALDVQRVRVQHMSAI
jgi:hypothetical protein